MFSLENHSSTANSVYIYAISSFSNTKVMEMLLWFRQTFSQKGTPLLTVSTYRVKWKKPNRGLQRRNSTKTSQRIRSRKRERFSVNNSSQYSSWCKLTVKNLASTALMMYKVRWSFTLSHPRVSFTQAIFFFVILYTANNYVCCNIIIIWQSTSIILKKNFYTTSNSNWSLWFDFKQILIIWNKVIPFWVNDKFLILCPQNLRSRLYFFGLSVTF